jgi:capsular polysaccharide biosynthesis protein
MLAIGAGVGSAGLKEFSDHSVRTAGSLSSALGLPVLAVIPDIVIAEEPVQVSQKRKIIFVGVAVALVCAIVIIHFFVMDLDVLWARIARRMNL